MKPTLILQDSNDLLHALQDGAHEPLTLRAGDGDHPAVFELQWDEMRPAFANISGTRRAYSQIRFYKSFNVADESIWDNLTVTPMGDFAAFNLDHAAYSLFTNVTVRSRVAGTQSHYHRKNWDEVTTHEGYGWQVTSRNTGDSSYAAKFVNCRAEYCQTGFDIQRAGVKGTVRWVIEDCVLDSNLVGIDTSYAGELWIRGGNIQLSREALRFIHARNVQIDFLNCERCGLDCFISPDSHEITAVNSRLTTVDDTGKRLRKIKEQHHLNVDSEGKPRPTVRQKR